VITVSWHVRPDQAVTGQIVPYFLAEYSGTFTVDHPDPVQAGLESGMQEAVQSGDGLVHGVTVQVKLIRVCVHGDYASYYSMRLVAGAVR